MPRGPQRLYVARTGKYLGVLRSPLVDGSGTFIRRDGSLGHIFGDGGVLRAQPGRAGRARPALQEAWAGTAITGRPGSTSGPGSTSVGSTGVSGNDGRGTTEILPGPV